MCFEIHSNTNKFVVLYFSYKTVVIQCIGREDGNIPLLAVHIISIRLWNHTWYLSGLFPAKHNKTYPRNKICCIQRLLLRNFICRTRTIGLKKFEPICAMYLDCPLSKYLKHTLIAVVELVNQSYMASEVVFSKKL